jgi:hypothetical protein
MAKSLLSQKKIKCVHLPFEACMYSYVFISVAHNHTSFYTTYILNPSRANWRIFVSAMYMILKNA